MAQGKHKQCKTCKCSKPHECFPKGGAHCSSCISRGIVGSMMTYGGMFRGGGGGSVASISPSQPNVGGSSGGNAVGAGVGGTATMQ